MLNLRTGNWLVVFLVPFAFIGIFGSVFKEGTPVVTVFSPVQVQQPRRWGPYHSRGTVLIPPVECAEKYRCRKERCRDYNCMDRITVDEVSEAISTWLDDSQRKEPRE